MSGFGKSSFLMLALVAGVATTASAQECDINEGRPREVGTAAFALTRAQQSDNSAQQMPLLRQAIKATTENVARIDRDNAVGRNFVLGKSLVLALQANDGRVVMRRGDLGFTSSPDADINLVAAIDTAFSIVETAMPHCSSETEAWRQSQPWMDMLNGAIALLTEGQLDSAEAAINTSLRLSRNNPYAPNLLASIAQRRNDMPRAIQLMRQTIELAQEDTAYREIELQGRYQLAAMLAQQAESAEGDARQDRAREAAAALQEYIREAPESPESTAARSTYAQMVMLTGDTASARQMYAEQIANPQNFSDMQLVNSGVVAARANQADDAAQLFAAALTVNANNRDALYNLAATQHARERFGEMLQPLRRLVELDPNNPDNWLLMAYAHQGLSRATTNQATRKMHTDSIVIYHSRSADLPTSVTVTEFTRGTSSAAVAGQVENRSASAKSFELTFEFLDRAGSVVGQQRTTVGPVAGNQAQEFRVELQQPGIMAWRYRIGS